MIEFRPDLIYVIFVIMATGFVVLTLPIGVLFTIAVPATGGAAMSAEVECPVRRTGPQGPVATTSSLWSADCSSRPCSCC